MNAVARNLNWAVCSILFLEWACVVGGVGNAQDGVSPRFATRKAFDRFVQEGWDSPWGLDYVFVHNPGARDPALVDLCCREVGVRWVNFADVSWAKIERRPARAGKHSYDWSDVDGAVKAWQRNGVHPLLSLRFMSPWASAPKNDSQYVYLKGLVKQLILRSSDYLPKPEHMEDLRQYVRQMVERYDGDGQADMPGLLFPVLHYQPGNEYYNEVFWSGTAEEYGVLLREFAAAARAACPQVKIVLAGIGFREVYGFYDVSLEPRTEVYVRTTLPKVPANMAKFVERSEQFSVQTVGFHDAYDILDARWPNYGIVAKSRELLRRTGRGDKEIWSAEIYSGFPLMEPVVLPNWTLQALPTPSRSTEYLRILTNKNHPRFDEINPWYRGLQAAQVVKICMVALDAGSRKLMMGWAVDAQHPLAVSTLSHHGLYSISFEKLWPSAYTYGLTIRKLEGLDHIRRVPMPENVYVYECTLKRGKQVLVAFHDDHIGQNHDDPPAEVTAEIPLRARAARITHIITHIGATEPPVETANVVDGRLRLRLTEYPVFIESGQATGN